MADDVDQLQVFPREQELVEVVQVDVSAPVILQSFQQSGNNCPLLFNPGNKLKNCMKDVKQKKTPQKNLVNKLKVA